MNLGIDASNIRGGGTVTHLVELLRVVNPSDHGFARVIVWGGRSTLAQIQDRPWLQKVQEPLLNRSLPMRLYWQQFKLARLARLAKCNVLFVPGGLYLGGFRPFVTMSQNMLPFEPAEIRRYKFSFSTLRLLLLRWGQAFTFRRARGLICLTKYAADMILSVKEELSAVAGRIIPHGINPQFFLVPRTQKNLNSYSFERPFRLLYVSSVDMYKHQWHVIEAVAGIRSDKYPVCLDLVGGAFPAGKTQLEGSIRKFDPLGKFVRYQGALVYPEIFNAYHQADAFIFASSCENLPIILLEAMASGLPIVCSNRGPMPEVLGEAGVYFNPEKPSEIADALKKLLDSPVLRSEKAGEAFQRAKGYSWGKCTQETFGFLNQVAVE